MRDRSLAQNPGGRRAWHLALNTPHAIADALAKPRFAATKDTFDAPAVAPSAEPTADADIRARPLAMLFDDVSIRAANELQNAELATVGDVLDLDASGLARANISDRTLRELREILGM